MNIDDMQLKNIIVASAKEAYNRNIGKKYPNPLRSRIFVFELSKGIFKHYPDNLYVNNSIKIDENNKAVRGEWLLDAFITKVNVFNGEDNYKIKTNGCWAIESEFDKSYKSFVDDFSKLLCIKSDNYLYINGFNQRKRNDRRGYMEKRLCQVKSIINGIGLKKFNLVYCFCPSPKRINGESYSFWDLYKKCKDDKEIKWAKLGMNENEELFDLIELYRFVYDRDKKEYSYYEII